ncbi:MAG TPA: MotA/TolQ/ExbB proton channel family protein [Solirubrobacterales bacterium]
MSAAPAIAGTLLAVLPRLASIDLGDGLSHIATVLRVPVLIAAVVLLILCALEVGRFAVEWWRRWRNRRYDLREVVASAIADPSQAAHYAGYARSPIAACAVLAIAAAPPADRAAATERALVAYELTVQRGLDRTRLLVRAGPAIGLMGTLIPLIPGLAALAGGDVDTLANDLRDAFGATVVGLLVGTVAFALTLTRTRMYTEDLAGLEGGAATAAIPPTGPPPTAPAPPGPTPTGALR